MALVERVVKVLEEWANIIDQVGDDVCRYTALAYTEPSETGTAYKYNQALYKGQDEIDKLIADVRRNYADEGRNYMDSFTTAEIVNGLWWDSIKTINPAMVDNPDDNRMDSMNGVCRNWIFRDGVLKENWFKWFFPRISRPGFWEDQEDLANHPIMRASMAWDDVESTLNGGDPLSEAGQKQALSILFKSEKAAKLVFTSMCGDYNKGMPMNTLRYYNPYLGFLCVWVMWTGGGYTAIESHGLIEAANKTGLRNYFNDDRNNNIDRERLGDAIAGENPEGAIKQAVEQTNQMLLAQYQWLQGQKSGAKTQQYYDGWFNDYFKNPRSLVNMCVVINELVNLDTENKYKHSLKCKEKLQKLGVGYKELFNISLGG